MRTPNLENMIEEVYEELSAKESMNRELILGLERIAEVRKVFDKADELRQLATKTTGVCVATYKVNMVTGSRSNGSVSNTGLLTTNTSNGIPPRLKAPLIPTTLGDKSSFKPGRPRGSKTNRREKS